MIRLLIALLFVAPAAGQPLVFGGLQNDGGISLGNDPDALLRAELVDVQAELDERLETRQAQVRWRLDRLETRRRDTAATEDLWEKKRRDYLRTRSLRPVVEDVDGLLTVVRGIDGVLVSLQERFDEELELLYEGGAQVRQLQRDLEIDRSGEFDDVFEVDEQLAALRGQINEQELLADELRGLTAAALEKLENDRSAYDVARLDVYREELPVLQMDDPELGGHPGFEVPGFEIAMEAMTREDEARAEVGAALRRIEQRRLELEVALDRQTRDVLEIKLELADLTLPVLRRRVARWEARRAELRTRQAGGVLAMGQPLIPKGAWAEALEHTRGLLAEPDRALEILRDEMDNGRIDAPRRTALFGIGLLGVLVGILVRRNLPRLNGWRPEGRVDDLVRAGLLPAMPLLPITVVCGGLAALHLVPDALLGLYRFSAVAPPLAAATIGVSYELFPVGGGAGLSAQLAGYYRRLIRLLAILAALLSLTIDLLPTLAYPEPAEDLVRAVLAGVLLLGWLAVALRKDEMLAIFGIKGATPQGPLQAGVARYYRVIALGPVLLWFLHAVGYENLARLLARGGLVTLCVALLAPWFYVRLTGLLGHVVGYPDGGGLLALGADTSKAAYRALAPLVLVGVGGVSALLVASGWDYEDNLIDNLVGSATYTLVRLGGSEVTPASLGLLALTAALTVLATRTITGALERNVYPLYDLDRATQATMTALVRYSSWGIGTLIGLKVVGFGAAVLGVVASVIGIGVGFGSQTIASNFIAGLMLLMTRRISVDDVIEVDGLVGRVVRISSYSTVVRTLDNLKVIVPNATLIDSQVVNWTVDDHKVRLQIVVGVAYGSDVQLVRRLLMQACEADARVLGWPKPMARFDDFADSALLFTVLPWIDDPDDRFVVASNLRFAIDALFREHDVEIAFPQQDIHLRTCDGVLQVQWQGPGPAPE